MFLNRVILIGRNTREPELRFTSGGAAVANFTLAVDRPYLNAQGERETDFIRVVAWRKLAETCANYMGKGRLVAVEGRLQVRTYQTPDGRTHCFRGCRRYSALLERAREGTPSGVVPEKDDLPEPGFPEDPFGVDFNPEEPPF